MLREYTQHDTRRVTQIAVLLACSLLIFAGCGSTDRQEIEPYTEKMWQEDQRLNQDRLKTEDQREKEKSLQPVRAAVRGVVKITVDAYNYLTGHTPFQAAKELLDPYQPDHRRRAVVYLADQDFGRRDPYVKYYSELAINDDDYLVRAIAVRALNRSRDRAALPNLIRALDDKHELVRLEAAKALANIPDVSAVQALLKHLEGRIEIRTGAQLEVIDESIDVRVACADALRSFRTLEVGQALVRSLKDRNFGIAWQARKSLNFMTGKDYHYDQAAWLEHLSKDKPFG